MATPSRRLEYHFAGLRQAYHRLAAGRHAAKCLFVEAFSSLWRIRGSVAVPVEADDGGLLSRLVGVFEDAGHKVSVHGADRIVLDQPWWLGRLPWWLLDDKDPEEIGPFEAGEIRRRGMKGRRALHYDLSLVPQIPNIVRDALAAIGLLGLTLPGIVGIPSTIVTAAVGSAIIYALNHFRWRSRIGNLFDRAFET